MKMQQVGTTAYTTATAIDPHMGLPSLEVHLVVLNRPEAG